MRGCAFCAVVDPRGFDCCASRAAPPPRASLFEVPARASRAVGVPAAPGRLKPWLWGEPLGPAAPLGEPQDLAAEVFPPPPPSPPPPSCRRASPLELGLWLPLPRLLRAPAGEAAAGASLSEAPRGELRGPFRRVSTGASAPRTGHWRCTCPWFFLILRRLKAVGGGVTLKMGKAALAPRLLFKK